ncbi:hypothetical protein [Luteimonas sp. R10]|uniref:hypothetical protein n=1 Tax=Luteimonas sp. R10 TaxID=3108176 RepID=UPI003091E287|nr:hypothetical protein U3649_10275 [Luteimonas sp. R10]
MNDHDDNDDNDDLSRRLRALPRQMVPPARAWARVAEQIGREGRAPTLHAARARARRRWPAVAGFAAAASVALLLALGLLRVPEPGPAGREAATATEQQAERLTGEYRAALAEVPVERVPEELRPALAELDRSAADILTAIDEAPGSGFLLRQLQRTYAQRLQLTRRAALDAATLLS